jgi:hypothetical protein
MEVIRLHTPVKHAKGRAGGGGERGADGGERPRLAERREATGGAERDVGRASGALSRAAARCVPVKVLMGQARGVARVTVEEAACPVA